jgi:multicomponent Na+:H+ antiporter subunit G
MSVFAALFNVAAILSLAVGVFFNTLGIVGILRFPDVYTRLHADTKATTFGSIFTSLAVILWAVKSLLFTFDFQWFSFVCHAVFAVVVLAVTNATASHALARAAFRSGVKPARTVCNALPSAAPAPGGEGKGTPAA